MLIGITGKKRSGKDTLADIIGYRKIAFADKIKEMVNLLNIPGDKDTVYDGYSKRDIYRKIGMGLRELDKDFWIKMIKDEIYGDVCISDVRFDNEAEFIKKNNGIIILVKRDESFDEHESEQGINERYIDFVFYNTSIEDLKKQYNYNVGSF